MGDNSTLEVGNAAASTQRTDPPTQVVDLAEAGGASVPPVMPPTGREPGDQNDEPRAKRRKAPLVWGGVAVLLVALVAAAAWYSADRSAPGTQYAGIDVGGKTTAEVASLVQQRFDAFEVPFQFDGTSVPVTAADLGLTVDADQTAREIVEASRPWAVWAWNTRVQSAPVMTIDDAAENEFFAGAWPDAFTVVEPALQYNKASATFSVVPGQDGQGVDGAAVSQAFGESFASADTTAQTVVQTAATPTITDEQAEQSVPDAQKLAQKMTFTVGGKMLLTVDPATAGSWVKVSADGGEFTAVYDSAAVQSYLETAVPEKLDPTPSPQTVLASDPNAIVEAGSTGKTLNDVSGFAADVAVQAGTGTTTFELPVTEIPFETKTVDRKIDVNLAARSASLIENGTVIATFPMSPGLGTNTVGQSSSTATDAGQFKVWYKTTSQTMRGTNPDGSKYETPNVKWATYYNGDEAFHGTYWHNKFGVADMSHGCVNLSEANAKILYDFAPIGTPVSVHY